MIPNAETPPKLNLTEVFLSNTGSELKCCLNNKVINHIRLTSPTMSVKAVQIPSAHTKTREYLDCNQVVTWTLKWTRRFRTTEKLITTNLWYDWNLQIYQLPNICSLWIYSNKDISCQKLDLGFEIWASSTMTDPCAGYTKF